MNLVIRTHLEAKAASTLRAQKLSYGKLYVPLEPCMGARGCDTLLPFMLPEDCQLEVEGPRGFHKIYVGVDPSSSSILPTTGTSSSWTGRSKREEEVVLPKLVDLETFIDNACKSLGVERLPIVELVSPTLGSVAIGLGPEAGFLNFIGPEGMESSASSLGDSHLAGHMRFSYFGYPSDIPARYLIPIAEARKGLLDFFLSGKLTEELRWENDSCHEE